MLHFFHSLYLNLLLKLKCMGFCVNIDLNLLISRLLNLWRDKKLLKEHYFLDLPPPATLLWLLTKNAIICSPPFTKKMKRIVKWTCSQQLLPPSPHPFLYKCCPPYPYNPTLTLPFFLPWFLLNMSLSLFNS